MPIIISTNIKNVDKLYLIALFIGALSELAYFGLYQTLYIDLNFSLILFIFVIRFLSGLGIFSTFSLVAMHILKHFSRRLKGNKKLSKIFIIGLNSFMVLLFVILVAYTAYGFIIGSFNLFTSTIGILTVVFSYYITPIWKINYNVKINDNILDEMREFFRGLKLEIIKGYYKYLSRDYLKAYSIDYIKFRVKWDKFRYRTSIYIIPMLALSSLILPLLLPLMIVLTAKIFFLRKTSFNRLDYIMIASYSIATIYLLVSAPISYLIGNTLIWMMPYFVGLSISFIAYINAMFLHERFI